MIKKLLNSLPGRLLCAAAVLLMDCRVAGAPRNDGVGSSLRAQRGNPLVLLRAAHTTVFAVFMALLAIALQAKPPQPGARWALRPGAALAVAAFLAGAVGVGDELHQATLPGRVAGLDDLLADAVGVCVGLWVARGVWR
jgi:hypothetical protein